MCCLRENILTLRLSVGGRTDARTDGRTHARTDGRTHARTDGRKIFTQYSGISSCSLGSTDYARAVEMMVLMALSTIASEQMKGTERMMEKALQVLDYLATHPDATIRFRATDMVMNIHSDASYLS